MYRIMSLTHDDVQGILKMIDAAEHLEGIEIVHGDFRLHVVRGARRDVQRAAVSPLPSATTPAPVPATVTSAPEATDFALPEWPRSPRAAEVRA